MRRDRFAPRRFGRSLASVHEELAPSIRSGFYLPDDLRAVTGPDSVRISGTVQCEGGIRVEVEERLRFVRTAWWAKGGPNSLVELEFYRYNAVLASRGTLFRYNGPHEFHGPFHHVHHFKVLDAGAETVTPLRACDVPSLRQVIHEAERWHWSNRHDTGDGN